METKRNLKYFIAPPISIVTLIGWVITAIMLVFVFFASTRMVGIVGIIVGLGAVIFSSGGKSNDTDIEYHASERIKDLAEMSMKTNEVYEKNFLKTMKPLMLRGYDFDTTAEPFYFKKGRDGANRTNMFMGASLIFTGEKVYIYSRKFSFLDESIDTTNSVSFKYSDLSHCEIDELSYKPKNGGDEINTYLFKIIKKDGAEAFKMFIDYGADSDKAVENINRTITVRTEELEKLAEEKARKLAEFRAKVAREAKEEAEKAEEN